MPINSDRPTPIDQRPPTEQRALKKCHAEFLRAAYNDLEATHRKALRSMDFANRNGMYDQLADDHTLWKQIALFLSDFERTVRRHEESANFPKDAPAKPEGGSW